MTHPSPDPHVQQNRPPVERGDVMTDDDGTQWRVVANLSNGVSRVRVGSVADEVIFGTSDAEPDSSA